VRLCLTTTGITAYWGSSPDAMTNSCWIPWFGTWAETNLLPQLALIGSPVGGSGVVAWDDATADQVSSTCECIDAAPPCTVCDGAAPAGGFLVALADMSGAQTLCDGVDCPDFAGSYVCDFEFTECWWRGGTALPGFSGPFPCGFVLDVRLYLSAGHYWLSATLWKPSPSPTPYYWVTFLKDLGVGSPDCQAFDELAIPFHSQSADWSDCDWSGASCLVTSIA
jgi:hypothetical protein